MITAEPPKKRKGILEHVIGVIALGMSLFHLYNGAFGTFQAYFVRIIHLLFTAVLVVLNSTRDRKRSGNPHIRNVVDMFWLAVALSISGYLLLNYEYLTAERFMFVTPLTPLQKVLGILAVLLVLELARRLVGIVLPLVAIVAILYTFLGPFLPGILYHKGFKIDKLLDVLYLTPEGIFGIPLGISANYLILFIIFGAFLHQSGFGSFLTQFAMGIAGWSKGGPAKVAVIASALMGMISGSSNANVVTTGSFTIPLMKKVGYKSHFAAAVEAAASTGGQIMPPIMGAAIFLMVEYTGISYIIIAKYALFPALLYFLSVGYMVHLEAAKTGLKGLPRDQLPDWKQAIKSGGHLVLPLVVLVVLLIWGFSPGYAGLYSILALVVVSMVRKNTRMNVAQILSALTRGSQNTLTVAVSCATAGVVIGAVGLTGIGVRFTASLVDMVGGNMYLTLVFAMVAGIILGMGLPTTAAYILMIALVVPALIRLGLPNYTAHLFAVYYACISLITPPVAITSYVAAGLAEAKMMKTAWTAMRLGLAAYIVPFMFVFGPALLLVGTWSQVLIAVVTAIIGVMALSSGLQGYWLTRLSIIERVVSLGAAITLIFPGFRSDIIGVLLFGFVLSLQLNVFGIRRKIGRLLERKHTLEKNR
jgi:TRAP transporter 4TM/12TM fusion protein